MGRNRSAIGKAFKELPCPDFQQDGFTRTLVDKKKFNQTSVIFLLCHSVADEQLRMSSIVFGNGTDKVHWKPSVESRGIFEVLSTCLLTMLLCVWTAVHLNVPPPGDRWGLYLRKIGWLILALLAPELVASTAWYACPYYHVFAGAGC